MIMAIGPVTRLINIWKSYAADRKELADQISTANENKPGLVSCGPREDKQDLHSWLTGKSNKPPQRIL